MIDTALYADKWAMVTNGVDVFIPLAPQATRQITTPHPFMIVADTEDELFAAVFVNPQRGASGEYEIEALTPKPEADISVQDIL